MRNFERKLKKALSCYEQNDYETALNICEKILEKDYNNEEALSLEGKLLYLKGELEAAKISWKINSDYNNNEEAKNYLNNIDKYSKEKELYEEALVYIKNNNKKKALEKLYLCSKDGFNKINVIKTLKDCDLFGTSEIANENKDLPSKNNLNSKKEIYSNENKKEDKLNNNNNKYLESSSKNTKGQSFKENIKSKNLKNNKKEKSNKQDKNVESNIKGSNSNNKISVDDLKFTKDTSSINSKNNSSKKLMRTPIIVLLAIVIIGTIAYISTKSFKDSNQHKETSATNSESNEKTKAADLNKEFSSALKEENSNRLYELILQNPKDKIPSEDVDIYNKAEEFLKTKGVVKFYEDGLSLFKEKKYEEALAYFKKALDFSEDSYLNPHIIYFIATSNDNLKNTDESIKYYKMYLDKYKKDTYTAECIYKLALLYKDKDKELAKKYASKIEDDYSDSIYYNDKIKDIIYS